MPELPEDPSLFVSHLSSLNLFETVSFSEEDLQRTRQYQEEITRGTFQKSFTSIDDYLKSLGMISVVKAFDDFSLPRVAQLTQRSNQFNLRTVRYTEADIDRIRKSDEFATLSFHLRDKFGDYGLIGVIILKKASPTDAFIDTWIMSCRVLKRGMEEFIVNQMAREANRVGVERLTGEYIPTTKNGMVKIFILNRLSAIQRRMGGSQSIQRVSDLYQPKTNDPDDEQCWPRLTELCAKHSETIRLCSSMTLRHTT